MKIVWVPAICQAGKHLPKIDVLDQLEVSIENILPL